MALKSTLFAACNAVVLLIVLGNPPLSDWVSDRGRTGIPTAQTIIGAFSWNLPGMPEGLRGPTAVKLILFVLLVTVLGGIAGRARPLAAFVGGWGAAYAAMAMAGAASAVLAGDEGRASFVQGIDRVTVGAAEGAGAIFWVGWTFGLAVLVGSFGRKQPRIPVPAPTPAPAPPPAWTPGAAPSPHPAPNPAPTAAPGFAHPVDQPSTPGHRPSEAGRASASVPPDGSTAEGLAGPPLVGPPPDRPPTHGPS